jgi:formylmethanofuran dehydrogenase subunit E
MAAGVSKTCCLKLKGVLTVPNRTHTVAVMVTDAVVNLRQKDKRETEHIASVLSRASKSEELQRLKRLQEQAPKRHSLMSSPTNNT